MPISSSVPTGALSTAEPCFAQPQVPLKKKLKPSFKIFFGHFTLLYCSGCGGGLADCRCRNSLSLALLWTSSEVLNKTACVQNRWYFFVKDNQTIQLQAAALCASCGSASGKRSGTFRGRNTSVSFCSAVSKNTIFTKFPFWGSS